VRIAPRNITVLIRNTDDSANAVIDVYLAGEFVQRVVNNWWLLNVSSCKSDLVTVSRSRTLKAIRIAYKGYRVDVRQRAGHLREHRPHFDLSMAVPAQAAVWASEGKVTGVIGQTLVPNHNISVHPADFIVGSSGSSADLFAINAPGSTFGSEGFGPSLVCAAEDPIRHLPVHTASATHAAHVAIVETRQADAARHNRAVEAHQSRTEARQARNVAEDHPEQALKKHTDHEAARKQREAAHQQESQKHSEHTQRQQTRDTVLKQLKEQLGMH